MSNFALFVDFHTVVCGMPTGMHWTDDKLRQIIAQHAPVLCLHKDERYLPCSVEWYIEHSELWLQQPNESSQVAAQSAIHNAGPNPV